MNERKFELPVEIPFCDIAGFLTDTEYEKAEGIINEDINIIIVFDYCKKDRDVGILADVMEYTGCWRWDQKDYGKIIESAVNRFLASVDVDALWGEKALESYNGYLQFLKHGL